MMRVMVVEDEEMIRKGIVMAVDWAALDCIVVGEAANGEQALAVAEDCQPTLIITDLKMPKMDGLEMVRRLREAGSRAYVIILTAYDSFAYAQTAIRLGAVDFLLKPFHDGDLENAVLALQKRIAAQTAPQPEPLPGVKPGPKSRYVREAMLYLEQNCGSSELSVGQAAAQLAQPTSATRRTPRSIASTCSTGFFLVTIICFSLKNRKQSAPKEGALCS